MKNCCEVVEKTKQVKKNATSGIVEAFAEAKGKQVGNPLQTNNIRRQIGNVKREKLGFCVIARNVFGLPNTRFFKSPR